MKTIFSFSIIILFLLLNCTSEKNSSISNNIIKNPLTLTMTLDDNLQHSEQFLLARPSAIAVNDANEIMVLDEEMVKVYNEDGSEKVIIGRKGQGPGEFERANIISIDHDGGFNIIDIKGINLFNNKNKYLSSTKTRENNILDATLIEFDAKVSYSSKSLSIRNGLRVSEYYGYGSTGDDRKQYYHLLLEKDDDLKPISTFENKGARSGNMISLSYSHLGKLNWSIYNDKVYYSYPDYIRQNPEEEQLYTINIFNTKTNTSHSFKYKYNLALLPDSVKNQFDKINLSGLSSDMEKKIKDSLKKFSNEMKNEKYYAPIKDIKIDLNRLFVFTYNTNEENSFLVDVFDLPSEKFLHSFFIPFKNTSNIYIKNKFLYYLVSSREVLAKIEKYKISEKIYN